MVSILCVLGLCSLLTTQLFVLADNLTQDSNNAVDTAFPKKTLYWRNNGEGFYSHMMQLKVLLYARYAAQSDRVVMIEDFHSKHYGNYLADTRICLILELPSYIQCVPFRITEGRMDCPNDLRIIYSKNNHVCYGGYPQWDNTRKLSKELRHDLSPFSPRLTFKSNLVALANKVKVGLGLTGDYVAIHWRRGDQLSVRCDRKSNADTSINCGDAADFVHYVNTKVKTKYPSMPILLVSNENDETVLRTIKDAGVILVNEDVVIKQLKLSVPSVSTSDVTAPILLSNETNSAVVSRRLTRDSQNKEISKSKKNHGKDGDSKRNEVEKTSLKRNKKSPSDASEDRLEHENNSPKRSGKDKPLMDKPDKKAKEDDTSNQKSKGARKNEKEVVTHALPQIPPVPQRNSKNDPIKKKTATLTMEADLRQLAIDSILLLDATYFLAFGISTFHDVVEAERMLRGKSYCSENQGDLSFCTSITLPNKITLNSTLLPYFSDHEVRTFLKSKDFKEGIPHTVAI